MRAVFDNSALLDNQNLIGAANSRKPVRNHKSSASLHQVGKTLLDQLLRFRVKAGRRFVENEDAWLGQNSAGNRNSLPLSS